MEPRRAHVARVENPSCEPEKNALGKAPFDPLTPRDVRSETFFYFHSLGCLFIIYVLKFLLCCFPFFAFCNFQFFSFFFFFLHHRSQLKHIFLFFFLLFAVDSSRETVSLSRFSTPAIILQFCNFNCFREWRARNGKCELKTNEI